MPGECAAFPVLLLSGGFVTLRISFLAVLRGVQCLLEKAHSLFRLRVQFPYLFNLNQLP